MDLGTGSISYTIGPGAHVNLHESFVSFKVMSLMMDSADLQRQSLAGHRVTQLLAPHVTENPLFFHATDLSENGFKLAVDQVILSSPIIVTCITNHCHPSSPIITSPSSPIIVILHHQSS